MFTVFPLSTLSGDVTEFTNRSAGGALVAVVTVETILFDSLVCSYSVFEPSVFNRIMKFPTLEIGMVTSIESR